jgi:hypothetical protein
MNAAIKKLSGGLLDLLSAGLEAFRRPKPMSAYLASIVYMVATFFLAEKSQWGHVIHIIWFLTAIPFFWVWTVLCWRKNRRTPSGQPVPNDEFF